MSGNRERRAASSRAGEQTLALVLAHLAGNVARSKGFQRPDGMGWSEGGTEAGQTALLGEPLRFGGVSAK